MKILIRDQQGVRALKEGYASEEELQRFLKEHPDLMPLEEIELSAAALLCIGWEVGLASGAEDILYIDQDGLLTVVETKLRRNPEARREVVGQILEYAAQMSTWSSADVERQAQKFFASDKSAKQYRECTLERAMELFLESSGVPSEFSYDDFLQQVQTNIDRGHFRLVIAIDEPPDPLLKTVEFVNRFSERFEIFLIQLKRFRDPVKEQNIFVPALFGRVATARKAGQAEEWDWEKYRVKLGWTEEAAQRGGSLLARLQHFAEAWDIETRFHQGWIDVRCYGRVRFGVQVTKQHKLEIFFWVRDKLRGKMPKGISMRQTKEMLFLSGALETLDDAYLARLCEATIRVPNGQP